MTEIEELLRRVKKPGRYIGGEWNSLIKDWNAAEVRIALVYPDLYEIGMSTLAIFILYELLNQIPEVLVERAFAPWLDMARELRASRKLLFSLESRRPLRDFDILGFSLSYELTYTNIPEILDLSGIPLLARDRGEDHPLVIAGGSGVLNPEPIAPFFDFLVIGEGEEVLLEIIDVYRKWKRRGGSKEELLRELALIEGIYVPSLYEVEYENGTQYLKPLCDEAKMPIRRRYLSSLPPPPISPPVPYIETVHDRGVIEIQRGCLQGCRFCEAGMIYRPLRERSPEEVIEAARKIVYNCGYEEIALLSLSTSDYSKLSELLEELRGEFRGKHLNLSFPSLRPVPSSVIMADKAGSPKRPGLTFAPETGTERLRRAINKPLSDEDLIETIREAGERGWRAVKLYFMIGLPTETREDVEGIGELLERMRAAAPKVRLRASITQFIPKPHTPFQWCAQEDLDSVREKQKLLRRLLRKPGIELSWHDFGQSLVEGILSRGDRRLGKVILRVWEKGGKFDAWSECFQLERWLMAAREEGLDIRSLAGERERGKPLPWQHIDTGVTQEFLLRECEKALRGEPTPSCLKGRCAACGLQRWDPSCAHSFRNQEMRRPEK